MGGLISSGVSGLNAYKSALDVVGHNIANVNNEAYSRQVIDFTSRIPAFGPGGYTGDGVQIGQVRRISNEFINSQYQFHIANSKQHETMYNNSKFMDRLLSGEDSSLNPQMQKLFKNMQDLSANPTVGRSVILSEANTLINKFKFLQSRFTNELNQVNLKLNSSIEQVNSLASGLAKLNKEIQEVTAMAGFTPGDLLDKRDALLATLSEHVSVRATVQENGMLNVALGNGQVIVSKTESFDLTTTQDSEDSSKMLVALKTNSSDMPILGITGGQIGGLLEYREKVLEKGLRMLDHTALGFAHTFNQQHKLGIDLNGNLGKNFFTDMNALSIAQRRAKSISTNAGNATFSVTIADISQVSSEKFELSYSSATSTYTLRRLSDNSVVANFAAAALPHTINEAGLTFTLDSGTVQDGDRFIIEPTRDAASVLALSINDTNEIAAASAMTISTGVIRGTGGAEITSIHNQVNGAVLPVGPITLTYDSVNKRFDASTGEQFAYDAATESGKAFTISVAGFADVTFRMTGTPTQDDTFILDKNTLGKTDGGNAAMLANLGTNKAFDDGLRNVFDVYNELVSMVGTKTFEAEVSERSSVSLLAQVKQTRGSISGVNLDEEAANLIKFTQAYRAAAQLIKTANDTFAILLNAMGG